VSAPHSPDFGPDSFVPRLSDSETVEASLVAASWAWSTIPDMVVGERMNEAVVLVHSTLLVLYAPLRERR
jgi:hypothetical protein